MYIDKNPGKRRWPEHYTPLVLKKVRADSLQVTLYKFGYLDTTINVEIEKNMENTIRVSLREADEAYRLTQRTMMGARKRRRAGRRLIVPTAIVMALGAGATVAAIESYNQADDVRQKLERGTIRTGADYTEKVYDNKWLKQLGDISATTATASFGVGACLLSLTVLLHF